MASFYASACQLRISNNDNGEKNCKLSFSNSSMSGSGINALFFLTHFKEENTKHMHVITMQGEHFLTFFCLI